MARVKISAPKSSVSIRENLTILPKLPLTSSDTTFKRLLSYCLAESAKGQQERRGKGGGECLTITHQGDVSANFVEDSLNSVLKISIRLFIEARYDVMQGHVMLNTRQSRNCSRRRRARRTYNTRKTSL